MSLAEPTTTLTDYALAGQGVWLAARLGRLARQRERRAPAYWAGAFAVMALGAFFGGTSHGFAPHLPPGPKAALWVATYWGVGGANLLLLVGCLYALAAGRLRRALLALVVVRFLVFAALVAVFREFRFVVYDYAATLAVLLLVSLHPRIGAWGARGWLLAAVAVSFAGAAVQRSDLDLHAHFNHNDLFHVVQMVGLYFFYRSARLFDDAAAPPAAVPAR